MDRSGSIERKVVSPDLLEERQKCNFNTEELAEIMNFGKEELAKKRELRKLVDEDPIMRNTHKFYDMTRQEQMENHMQRIKRAYQLDRKRFFFDLKPTDYNYWFAQNFQGLSTLGLHYSMFHIGMANYCTDEQKEKWLPLVRQLKILGTYAQTELGHGSYVQGIETTSTYDQEKDEFVIHTPTISATKYWPGDMGLISNYGIVFARLIIKQKDHGIQPFLVPLRSQEDHRLLPGVTAGDIGPKFGYNSKNNGFLSFNQVRIPRSNMLMKFASVDRQGNFKLQGDQRILYGVMLFIRVEIVLGASYSLAQGLTIATRYAAVRRQFHTVDGQKLERKILDYQTHMFKLAPLLSYAYAFGFAGQAMVDLHQQLLTDIEKKDFKNLEICHHLSSGFKSFFSTITYNGLDFMRQSCGGAGFSSWSGFTQLIQDYAPNTTFEGDNTVMAQQSSRFLLKNLKNISKGFKATGIFTYLNDIKTCLTLKCSVTNAAQFLDLVVLDEALKVRTAKKIADTYTALSTASGSDNELKNSLFAVDIVEMTRSHIMYVTFQYFKTAIEKLPSTANKNMKENLEYLAMVYALTELQKDSADLYETGYFPKGASPFIQDALKKLMELLRPQMIGLVESFAVADSEITSAIGNYYGDIYETQLKWAKESRLNQHEVVPGFEEYILPILKGKL